MSTPVGIIKKFVKTLVDTESTGTAAVNEAFKAVGATSYSALQSAFNQARNSSSNNQNFLEQSCGVRINNTDTGAITGSDAGGTIAKTAASIVPETAAAVELTSAQYNSFTQNGLTVKVTYENLSDEELEDYDLADDFNYSSANYPAKQRLVTRALYNWWIPESLDLINQSLGINFTDGRANVNELNIKFDNDIDAVEINFSYDMGLASRMTMTINPAMLYNLTASDKNGTLP